MSELETRPNSKIQQLEAARQSKERANTKAAVNVNSVSAESPTNPTSNNAQTTAAQIQTTITENLKIFMHGMMTLVKQKQNGIAVNERCRKT